MADAMRCMPWQRADVWGDSDYCGGRVHSGILNPERQPLVSADGRTRAWVDGEYRLTRPASAMAPAIVAPAPAATEARPVPH